MNRFACLLLLFVTFSSTGRADDGPLPPGEAAGHMQLPKGFAATLFAGEPDVVQPIAFTLDDRGRMWVVECQSYPAWGKEPHDRVLIFSDRDGDGHFDDRQVFLENGSNLSGIELGHGGVWLCSIPNLVFVPDADGDDRPDGPAQVVLDGWNTKTAGHNAFNSLIWGPDGWLYGCNGIQSNSEVGVPGTPADQRLKINCGVWRYHPQTRKVEAVAHGTTNPWGLDFDDYGECFITNCVISHLWHVVPGAHLQRMYGQDYNPYVYALMSSCADHLHWAGGPWAEARGGEKHHAAGGGHAHSGAMIYLGDNWPGEYRNHLFTCNLHGNRVNQDVLEQQGAGYIAHHGVDFLMANDPWFRGLAVQYGPDGGAYVSDWTDTGECHNYQTVDRTNGRIYKVVYGKPGPWQGDLRKLSDAELVKLQLRKNDWFVRHARRLLHERHMAGKLAPETVTSLVAMLHEQSDPTRRLRALWALYVTGGLEPALLREMLGDDHPYVRGWAIRLALEDGQASAELLARLATLAKHDPSPVVRLKLASVLQRMSLADRWEIAAALLNHAEDAAETNLSLMLWYAVEPLVPADKQKALALLAAAKIPLVRQFIARRLADEPAVIVAALGQIDDGQLQLDLLRGLSEAFAGRRQVARPTGWKEVNSKLAASPNEMVREQALLLSLLFGDRAARESLRKTAADRQADMTDRRRAVSALVQVKDADLVPLLKTLVTEPALAAVALRGLAAFEERSTPKFVLEHYATLSAADKSEAVGVLASRPRWALELLAAVESGAVPRGDLSTVVVRQLSDIDDKLVRDRLEKVWGAVRQTAADRTALVAKYRAALTPAVLEKADTGHGRLLFAKSCASCHVLFDAGGRIGPDLTGSQRTNLDYVLSNVLDPSAVVVRDYQLTLVSTKDGRVISGLVKAEDDRTLTLQTANELLAVPKDEIENRKATTTSMMPDGLLEKLSDSEIRDLVGYLASPAQVPLPDDSQAIR